MLFAVHIDFKRDPVQISRIIRLGRKLHTLSVSFLRPSQSPCPCVQSLNCCYGVRLVRASVLGHTTLNTPSPVLSCRRAFLYSQGCIRCITIAPYSGTILERRLLICFEFTQHVISIGLRTASCGAKLHVFDIIISLQQGFFLINLRSVCFLSWLMGGKTFGLPPL
ncbi:hypothetical protein B0H14DRAFT_335040 [Mycena olivaceomarginata]|nr:hypothetical protein B0H14DRAFT_335040 [Mycena olivaceomarginata]